MSAGPCCIEADFVSRAVTDHVMDCMVDKDQGS